MLAEDHGAGATAGDNRSGLMSGQDGTPALAAGQRLRQVARKAAQHVDHFGAEQGLDHGRVVCGLTVNQRQGADIDGTQLFKPANPVLCGMLMIVVRCRRRWNNADTCRKPSGEFDGFAVRCGHFTAKFGAAFQ